MRKLVREGRNLEGVKEGVLGYQGDWKEISHDKNVNKFLRIKTIWTESVDFQIKLSLKYVSQTIFLGPNYNLVDMILALPVVQF